MLLSKDKPSRGTCGNHNSWYMVETGKTSPRQTSGESNAHPLDERAIGAWACFQHLQIASQAAFWANTCVKDRIDETIPVCSGGVLGLFRTRLKLIILAVWWVSITDLVSLRDWFHVYGCLVSPGSHRERWVKEPEKRHGVNERFIVSNYAVT